MREASFIEMEFTYRCEHIEKVIPFQPLEDAYPDIQSSDCQNGSDYDRYNSWHCMVHIVVSVNFLD